MRSLSSMMFRLRDNRCAQVLCGAVLLLTSQFVTTGCDATGADYSQLELVNVSGQVTLEDQPLEGAVVTFESPDGQFSYGLTDANGNYSLRLDSVKSGVTPGPKTVRISTSRRILGLNAEEGAPGAEIGDGNSEAPQSSSTPIERLPARYHQASELKADVTSGNTNSDFALKSK